MTNPFVPVSTVFAVPPGLPTFSSTVVGHEENSDPLVPTGTIRIDRVGHVVTFDSAVDHTPGGPKILFPLPTWAYQPNVTDIPLRLPNTVYTSSADPDYNLFIQTGGIQYFAGTGPAELITAV